jgi:GGDEF domain-containing protein
VLPHTELAGATQVGERILATLAGEHVVGPAGDVPISCSLGASTLLAPVTDSPARPLAGEYFRGVAEALIGSADGALYRAKKLGGGQICRADPISWPAPADASAAGTR